MIGNFHTDLTQTKYPVTLVNVRIENGDEHFVIDELKRKVFRVLGKVTNAQLKLEMVDSPKLKKMGITYDSIKKVTHVSTIDIMRNPCLIKTILGQYSHGTSIHRRFKAHKELSKVERSSYTQLSNSAKTEQLRQDLLSLIDDDLKEHFKTILDEGAIYGVSAWEVNEGAYNEFIKYYKEMMELHGVDKKVYIKLDVTTQKVQFKITDPRFLNAKLTPLQLLIAAFILGEPPAISNCRFMNNPPTKNDGKYREWMIHFDNSNYAPECKQITTRNEDNGKANNEQCLAAFPYNTKNNIRFTKSEAATKFPTMNDLQQELSNIPGACYAVINNPNSTIPIQTTIRTEVIPHHRSASSDKTDKVRASELITFHGVDRCKAILTPEELERAPHLTSSQHYVLGGFRNVPQGFIEALAEDRVSLNAELRKILAKSFIPLKDLTVAEFSEQGILITKEELYSKQVTTYDNLPDTLDQIPRLDPSSANFTENVFTIVNMLMNYDQNAELKPDCSENKAFPARTQLRERTDAQFIKPLKRDLQNIKLSNNPNSLLTMDKLIDINHDIKNFYLKELDSLKKFNADPQLTALFESRAELAREYISQFPLRATNPETHQVLSLFTYYMIADLDEAAATLHKLGAIIDSKLLDRIKDQQQPLLQHFIAHRMLSDQLSD